MPASSQNAAAFSSAADDVFARIAGRASQIEEHGFDGVTFENLTLGILALHMGVKR